MHLPWGRQDNRHRVICCCINFSCGDANGLCSPQMGTKHRPKQLLRETSGFVGLAYGAPVKDYSEAQVTHKHLHHLKVPSQHGGRPHEHLLWCSLSSHKIDCSWEWEWYLKSQVRLFWSSLGSANHPVTITIELATNVFLCSGYYSYKAKSMMSSCYCCRENPHTRHSLWGITKHLQQLMKMGDTCT